MKFLRHIALVISTFCLFFATSATAQNSPCFWQGTVTKCFPTTGIYLDNSRSLRLGTNDTTHYVELKAANAVGTNYTITYPAAVCASGQGYTQNGSGVQACVNVAVNPTTTTGDVIYASTTASPATLSRLAIGTEGKQMRVISSLPAYAWQQTTASKSASGGDTTYTITDTDGFTTILGTTGTHVLTIVLPAVANNTGRQITIKKVDSGSGKIIINTNASETADGWTTTTIGNGAIAQFAFITLTTDGSTWSSLGAYDHVEVQQSSFVNAGDASRTTVGTLIIPAGGWTISGILIINKNGATFDTSDDAEWCIDTSGSCADGVAGYDIISGSPSASVGTGDSPFIIAGKVANLTGSATYLGLAYSNVTAGTARYRGSLSAYRFR